MEARKMPELLQTASSYERLAWTPVGGLLSHLGKTLREEREARGVILAEIVATLKQRGVNIRSDGPLSRFERGLTKPHELELLLAAYADVLDLKDARDIVADAVRLWYENGEPPSLNNSNVA